MDRHHLAYLILAVSLLALAVGLLWARYHSRDQVIKRSRFADKTRWADRDRRNSDEAPSAD